MCISSTWMHLLGRSTTNTHSTRMSFPRRMFALRGALAPGCLATRWCCRSASSVAQPHHGRNENTKPFYITTPIFYVNGAPHIGHLYSAVLADATARWQRLRGRRVIFSTGTDEHGQKVQAAAAASNQSPKEFCDRVSLSFKSLFDTANISYTHFIRTTDEAHIRAATAMWRRLVDAGDIYMGKHEGWYSVTDEAFVPAAQVTDGTDASGNAVKISKETGGKLEWVTENNYKFRLTKYADRLLDWINSTPSPVQPSNRIEEVRAFVASGLGGGDLSVSRTRDRLEWGIPVPDDPDHTMYVWLDALTNYLTVAGFPESPSPAAWPADYHVVGKDILRFHAVYWPAFLMAAGLEPPRTVLAHGHFTRDRQKMSKSVGNIVDPMQKIEEYGVDVFRYILLRESSIATDGDYSDDRARAVLNGELADSIGNLLARCTSSSLSPTCAWPEAGAADCAGNDAELALLRSLGDVYRFVPLKFDAFDFSGGLGVIAGMLRDANRYLTQEAPWKLMNKGVNADAASKLRVESVLHNCLEALRVGAIYMQPVMPTQSARILDHLGVPAEQRTPDCAVYTAKTHLWSFGLPENKPKFTKVGAPKAR